MKPFSRTPTGASRRAVSAPRAAAPVILLSLRPADVVPLYAQVYEGIREAIMAGRIGVGARVPSSRTLAAELGVSRTTITVAFDQLRSEGYIRGSRGGGSRVEAAMPELATRPTRAPTAQRTLRGTPSPRTPLVSVSTRGGHLVQAGARLVANAGTSPRPFRIGVPTTDVFPTAVWAKLTSRRWRAGTVHLGDGDPAGDIELREAIATYLTNARGARCSSDQVIVVSGTQQALDLAARVLLDPGDHVWMEDPGYGGAQSTFTACDATIVPVPVDDEGMRIADGVQLHDGARMAYVTPSHQFPLGSVMSASRRLALLSWSHRVGAWIIEDDYDSEFRYTGRPLPCLQGLEAQQYPDEANRRVLYVGTFNKVIASGLRCGYLVVPDALIEPMRAARAATDRHPPTPLQGVLTDFIREGHFARHIRRLRALYAQRQVALLSAADTVLRDHLSFNADAAGLHLVGRFLRASNDTAVAARALEHGVEVQALSSFFANPTRAREQQGLVLSYAGFDEFALCDAVDRLARSMSRR